VARLAIGPAHPVFYGFIAGGAHPAGEPFVATNADNMIGSLAASPAGDGVDFGGHFWIPEGTASNIEELELLWPMLFLYRRALKAGADGAGRFRGGRGFVEAGIPWTVPGLAAAVYTDESFPKAVGPFGGNPASAGHFRLKHGTDVTARLAAGEVPQGFDAIDGAEAEVEAKGPMLMMGADAAWEWTGANAPGFGDPLSRDPGQVEADIAAGALSPDAARRVYGVVPGDGNATEALRIEYLAARLADAVPPVGTPVMVPAGVPLRVLAGELAVTERDGQFEEFVTATGRAVLAPADGNFKDGCAVLERPLREVAPEFAARQGRAGYLMRYREYLCPVTGLRVDSEIIAAGAEALHDIVLSGIRGLRATHATSAPAVRAHPR
jgi:N-methylhydantoinase B